MTRHHDDERWPAGAYPTQSEVDDGMTQWVADDEPLEDTDVVLWYVFGIHHITRAEDWPIMPADTVVVLAQAVRVLRPQPLASTWRRRRRPRAGHCHTGVDAEHAHL